MLIHVPVLREILYFFFLPGGNLIPPVEFLNPLTSCRRKQRGLELSVLSYDA